MKEEIRNLACEQRWHLQYLVETLAALTEDAIDAVPVERVGPGNRALRGN